MSDLEHHSPFAGGGELPLGPHLPPGFEDTFGPMPDSNKYASGDYRHWAADVGQWIVNLGLFAEAGAKPAWASVAQILKANADLDTYGVPHPKYFRFNFRAEDPRATGEWQAIIPAISGGGFYQCAASLVIQTPRLAVAEYQEDSLQRGLDPTGGDRSKRSPFIRDWPGDPKQPDSEHEG